MPTPLRKRKEAAWELLTDGLFAPPFGASVPGGGLTYLLRDEFITAQAAPITTPRTCEPGPGTLAITDSANNNIAIAGGKLVVTGTLASGGRSVRTAAAWTRVTGRMFEIVMFEMTTPGTTRVGLDAAADNVPVYRIDYASATTVNIINNTTTVISALNPGSYPHKWRWVLKSTGAYLFWDTTLIWIYDDATFDAVMYIWMNDALPYDWKAENFSIRDLSGLFTSDYGIATFRDTSLVTGDTFTGTADGIHNFEVTLEADPDAADEVSLNFRRQDATNKIRAIIKRNAGDTAWDFQVRVVTAGTPAVPAGWSDVTGIGTPDAIRVVATGTSLAFYTRASGTWTKRGATLTNSSFQTEAGLEIEAAAGNTLNAVDSYPRTSSNYDQLGFS